MLFNRAGWIPPPSPNITPLSGTDHVQGAAIAALCVLLLRLSRWQAFVMPQCLCQSKGRFAITCWPAGVLLFLPLMHFHSVESAWQRTTQNPQRACWNGGNVWTGLVHALCACVCMCVFFLRVTTPLAHLAVTTPTRKQKKNKTVS